jgi:hypothetical protein
MRSVARLHIDGAGGHWNVVTARFRNESLGKAAYEFVMARMERGDLGVYRHGRVGEGGVMVSAVSVKRGEVLRVSRLLANRGGEDEELPSEVYERMCIRRAVLVTEAAQYGAPPGRFRVKHPGRGAYLGQDGSMRETAHGEG